MIISVQASAQVRFEKGEINLRGTLIFDKKLKEPRLTVNSGNRAMKSFELESGKISELLKNYKSGTKVEVCMDMKEAGSEGKLRAELLKIRPLAPNEAVLVYTGTLKGCASQKGCKEFGKNIESSLLGDSAQLQDQPSDYFGCLP
jgi:hypothetical protein